MDTANAIICPCCGEPREGYTYLADALTCQISTLAGQVRLSDQQFRVAEFLLRHSPTPVTREKLYDAVLMDYTGGGPEMKILDVIMCRVRPAMESIGFDVVTEWGKGWRVVALGSDGPAQPLAVMRTPRGRVARWNDALDAELRELMARKFKPAQIAAIMKKPYGAVERAMKRLAAKETA